MRYAFDAPDEALDLGGGEPFALAEVDGGDLVLDGWDGALADHAGRFLDVSLEVTLGRAKGELVVAFDDVAVVLGPKGGGAAAWADVAAAPRRGAVEPGRPVLLRACPVGPTRVRVVAKQGATTFADLVADARWPVAVGLGARGGRVRLAALRVRGRPDPAWLSRAEDRVPFDLERALDRWRAGVARDALGGADGALDPEWDVASLEDPALLAGVPAAARAEVDRARRWLRRGLVAEAASHLRQAVALGAGRYHAAQVLLARAEVEEASRVHAAVLAGPRIRLDQVLAAVGEAPEALALRSEVALTEGRLADARADAEAALALRPDLPAARLALAQVEVHDGRLERAVDEARLAAELAEGRPAWEAHARQLEALAAGPPWSQAVRRESAHYVLHTDQPARADEVLATLEAAREAMPRVFPCLRAREGARVRKGVVLLFRRPEDYYRHAWRTGGDRMERTAGYFSPRTGQLMLFEADAGPEATLRVLRHEATHQWVHSLGLALPYWCNEAIADYLGGWDGARSAPDAEDTRALLAPGARLSALFDLMTMSPAEFYAGDAFTRYAQAWSFVHFCMEGGDPRARRALFDYLARHGEGRAGDRSGQAGVRLDHLYADTFHQLDMKRVTAAWWAHARRLGAEAERRAAGR